MGHFLESKGKWPKVYRSSQCWSEMFLQVFFFDHPEFEPILSDRLLKIWFSSVLRHRYMIAEHAPRLPMREHEHAGITLRDISALRVIFEGAPPPITDHRTCSEIANARAWACGNYSPRHICSTSHIPEFEHILSDRHLRVGQTRVLRHR